MTPQPEREARRLSNILWCQGDRQCDSWGDAAAALEAQVEQLTKERDRLKEALRPFDVEITEAQRRRGYISWRTSIEHIDTVRAALSEQTRGAE
jgi:predicted RNase H-like nuclease (RuvC/YqgF family)